ncbi:hypothetical protein IMSAGC008_00174 [Muribaculaceae bacterium]|nr:hypothetical protein IMSAGC008_00174 [Muribaculaceae bacterium]
MNTNKRSRRVSSKKLRALLNEITDEICAVQDKVTLSLAGNSFTIHLEGATVNLSINQSEKGGKL